MQKLNRHLRLIILFFAVLIPFSVVHAGGEYLGEECKTIKPTKKVHKAKKPKRHKVRKHQPLKRKVVRKKQVTVVEEYPPPYSEVTRAQVSTKIFKKCRELPTGVVQCYIINPADIVDLTCGAFAEKIESCESYTCQAPSAQDPTIKTTWSIIGKAGDRCVVSNITDDVGMKDKNGNVTPLSQTCEYDEVGIKGLVVRFEDMKSRYYHFSTNEHFEGIHNCNIKTIPSTVMPVDYTPTLPVVSGS